MIISDYHMHTPLCGHAVGEPYEYVEQAIKLGLKEMGFSCHAPFVKGPLPDVTMSLSELPTYHKMIEDVRDKYKDQIDVFLSIEADYLPGYEAATMELLSSYPYEYVIGSVHFIDDWGFDDPAERDKWNQSDVNQVYKDYHKLLRKSAQSGLFDIIAHCDLVKKFGARPTIDLSDEIHETAEIFKQYSVAIELNTSGWRKPCEEQYPALDNLKIYAEHHIPLTFGSDAHQPDHVGCDFDKALEIAKAAGFKEYVTFRKRKINQRFSLRA